MTQPAPKQHASLTIFCIALLCAVLLWRLSFFSAEKELGDVICSCLFLAFACFFVARTAKPLLSSPVVKWWLLYGVSLFALWPFWESSLPHFLKYPVLLSPLFVSIALYAAPDLAQKYVAAVLITAGCFHGVACLWQFFIVYPELLADAEVLQLTKAQVFRLNEGRTLGLSTSPDLAAMLCIAGLFCSISFFQNTPQYRPVLLLSLILTFCGVTLTRSTGGLLSILVGLGVVFIAHRKNKKVLNLFLCLLVMFGGLSLFLSFRGFDALATSSHERFLNWTGAFDIIKHNFWQGVGPGQFPAAYELYRPMGSNITRYAHSFPLQLTAELGILGLVLAAFVYGFLFKAIMQLNDSTKKAPHIWLLGLVVALWVHNLVDYGFQHPQTVTLLALVTFLAFPPNESVTTVSPMTHRSRLALLALFGVFMAYGIVFLAQRNQVLQNSRNLTESAEPLADWIGKYPTDFEALIAMMARTHFQHQQCPENCDHWQKKSIYLSVLWEKQDPPISAGWLLAARIALKNERPEQARRYIDHALALHPGMPQA